MPALIMRKRAERLDPAPSKWKYRYQRWMLTPGVRAGMRIGLPAIIIIVIATSWYSREANREYVFAQVSEWKAQFQQRPEFMITSINVNGADDELRKLVFSIVNMPLPASSFELDIEDVRVQVNGIESVEAANVRVGQGGVLEVDVIPRKPVAIWRDNDTLRLLGPKGELAGAISARAERPDLPLIAGDGAATHIESALALFAAMGPIKSRVRGLVRMGERRWDVILDRDQRILLPNENPLAALDRVIVLHQAQDMLERDIATVDMRNSQRPTLRMNQEAAVALRRVGQTEAVD